MWKGNTMNKKISLGATISIVAIAAAITLIITMSFTLESFNGKISGVKELEENYKKLAEIDSRVRTNYNGTIDEDAIQDAIAQGYMAGLDDKYARYYSAEEYAAERLAGEGKLVGIGITVSKEESGYIQITAINDKSPALEAGLEVDDIIVKVDGEDVLKLGYDGAVSGIRGEEGEKVSITVRRGGEDINYELTRKSIDIISVTQRVIDDIGYIRISEFNSTTLEQFNDALKSVMDDNVTSIVFDVRNNGGGSVNSVVGVLDRILPEGDIAYAIYKSGEEEVLGTSDADHIKLPMVVIVNENTASAAELFAAAIRDYDKGKLIGVTTYGKGVMQNTYTLQDGSAITLTTAFYYPPSKNNYDGEGLKPDYEQDLNPELVPKIGTLSDEEDTQLKKAIEVISASKS